ncbi:sodium:solute symporter family transporter [Rickettsia typhi]|uniref:histidine kinase n=2 Tax=Rickettsia typhi TaxID=785 RepID=Q68WR4_RICTY|nr:ATP-binding protein [Rickettsia typhi]AAU03928.1 two-component sensor histidine kinase [Rickettsia typhi str. Wilmington]AFE54309.1 two-component sensor histidine kinase [Rickettsia typhi str. TH1527]AFE55149.1 two-component sensor histidine kinase [Rickettsia typhi str. B9991CWPP]
MPNIDLFILTSFLGINLLIGLLNIKNIKNNREYAVGERNFSTSAIVATLIATWISTSIFLIDNSIIYQNGLFYLLPSIFGSIVSWLLMSYFIAPRCENILGSLSVAEIIGAAYGNKVRILTAIVSILMSIGRIAMQFHVAGLILQLFFNISNFYINLCIATIIISYSAFGGVKSVTFTKAVQFFTYSLIIPIIGIVIWNVLSDPYIVINSNVQNSLIDLQELFHCTSPKFWIALNIFIYFAIPSFSPSIFQSILIAKDTKQISRTFFISAVICLCWSIIFIWITILLSQNSVIETNELFLRIIKSYIGFKGLIVGVVMAMIIASTNSYINVAAVTFTNDIIKKTSLNYNYITAITIGLIGFIISLYTQDLINLFLLLTSIYFPLITLPLILLIYGFKSTTKSFFIGTIAAIFTIISWQIFSLRAVLGIYPMLPTTIVTLIFFLGRHYILKQPGGFSTLKEPLSVKIIRQDRKRKFLTLFRAVKNFNIFKYWKSTLPNQEITYSYVGIFILISMFSSLYTTSGSRIMNHLVIYNIIYHTTFIAAAILITYPLWSLKFKKKYIISFSWFIATFVILIFFGSLLVILNDFDQLQLMYSVINSLIIATIFRWQATLLMTVTGVFASIEFYKYFIDEKLLISIDSFQFKVVYFLTLFSSLLIVFLKPRQDQEMLINLKNTHLGNRVNYREQELEKLLDLKHEFLRNINHEINTPLTGIISLGETLWANYDKFNEDQRRNAVEIIAKSSIRLNSLINNILDFSKLSSLNYELNKNYINLSELLHERIKICKKLYLNGKILNFVSDIEENIIFNCDPHYIQHTFDNLIINAISYSSEGTIKIDLQKQTDSILFMIKDDGIGVPKEELPNIFGVFVVSSKTRTQAGGRGVGLALCKKVIELHSGKIWAENDKQGKTHFIVTMPL